MSGILAQCAVLCDKSMPNETSHRLSDEDSRFELKNVYVFSDTSSLKVVTKWNDAKVKIASGIQLHMNLIALGSDHAVLLQMKLAKIT